MQTRPQDILWVVVAVLCVAAGIAGLVLMVTDFTLWRLLGAPFAVFIAAGAWRRTKWGAPAEGLREYQERRALARKG